ncbi:MAG: 6-hydroxycyclohex-1-ene-1-carbonyl-CoA dehydrogenase [Planctomycetes bacterium]|nr:6-hydroxycyclohex-1-ene-1-carbonyl-CoA dehydrogenase [Planctomycetota bacterium]
MKSSGWEMTAVNAPLSLCTRDLAPAADQVVVEVAGCGVCHTDLGFLFDGVPIRHALPLILGHEISGRVVDAGSEARDCLGQDVVVPAVMPCGCCDLCRRGRGSICPDQIFPGNDLDGGFASHVVVPAAGLAPVASLVGSDLELADLSVIADAVTTPYQSLLRSGLGEGDLAVVVGVGGVGAFAVQIARAMGATCVAIDIDPERLELAREHGASLTVDSRDHDARSLKKALRGYAKDHDLPAVEWKIFETSGSPAGQATAFSLLNHGAYLGVVGYTPKSVEVRLSNLMAFDARAEGNWGCLPEHYPAVIDLVLSGKVQLAPFIERRPMSAINDVFADVHARRLTKRIVLTPDF